MTSQTQILKLHWIPFFSPLSGNVACCGNTKMHSRHSRPASFHVPGSFGTSRRRSNVEAISWREWDCKPDIHLMPSPWTSTRFLYKRTEASLQLTQKLRLQQ